MSFKKNHKLQTLANAKLLSGETPLISTTEALVLMASPLFPEYFQGVSRLVGVNISDTLKISGWGCNLCLSEVFMYHTLSLFQQFYFSYF